MSRKRESQVIILDCNRRMGSDLEIAKDAMLQHVQQRIIGAYKTSFIGLVLVGSARTSNAMHDLSVNEGENGYQGISVEEEIKGVTTDLLRSIDTVRLGSDEGDYLDAVTVAADLLMKEAKQSPIKQIILVTNGSLDPVDEEDVKQMAPPMVQKGIGLVVHGINFSTESDDASEAQKSICQMAKAYNGEVFKGTTEGVKNNGCVKSVKPVTTFRDFFQITNQIKVKVWAYPAVRNRGYAPSMKKRSLFAQEAGDQGITRNTRFFDENDPDTEIQPTDRIRCHIYGKEEVPVTDDVDTDALLVKQPKGMNLLAFVPRDSIKQHYLRSWVNLVVPDETAAEPSAAMIAALVAAMEKKKQVAIVKWNPRNPHKTAGSKPHLHALFPFINLETNQYYWHAIELPFRDDLREASFPPLFGSKNDPSDSQVDAAKNFVQSLNLMSIQGSSRESSGVKSNGNVKQEEEAMEAFDFRSSLEPAFVANPVAKKFLKVMNVKVLKKKGEEGEREVQEAVANNDAAKDFLPDPKLWHTAAASVDAFSDAFKEAMVGVIASSPGKKRKRRDEEPEDKEEEELKKQKSQAATQPLNTSSFMSQSKAVSKIDSINPLEQFDVMWGKPDLDAHEVAITQMGEVIGELVDNSVGDRYFEKAVRCLWKLRERCEGSRSDEPELFNEAFEKLRAKYQDNSSIHFWKDVEKEGIKRIPLHSDVAASETGPGKAPEPVAAAQDEDEDLLD